MQPTGQHRSAWKRAGFACEVNKYLLGDILGQMRVPTGLSERGGINQGKMTPNKFGEGGFGTGSVSSQELLVVQHGSSLIYSRRYAIPDTKSSPVPIRLEDRRGLSSGCALPLKGCPQFLRMPSRQHFEIGDATLKDFNPFSTARIVFRPRRRSHPRTPRRGVPTVRDGRMTGCERRLEKSCFFRAVFADKSAHVISRQETAARDGLRSSSLSRAWHGGGG